MGLAKRPLRPSNLERETGIEPATNGLGSRYSTIELLPPSKIIIQAGPRRFMPLTSSNKNRLPGTPIRGKPLGFMGSHYSSPEIAITNV
jgi:hypothetical protein